LNELLPLSIGIGLVVSLLFTETFGVAAGGMIVPGYLALHLTRPLTVLMTIAAAFATYAVVHALSSFTILYGRRRTVMMILIGYAMGGAVRLLSTEVAAVGTLDLDVVGYIIPGLIAIWLDRQGVVETLAALITASSVVRLLLVLVAGLELPQ
jgi:poly-gamma-glutamate biosynthesis protein PgsC/CapC